MQIVIEILRPMFAALDNSVSIKISGACEFQVRMHRDKKIDFDRRQSIFCRITP